MSSQNWEIRFSNSRQRIYFYSPVSGESLWDPPAGLSHEEIMNLPGASKYLGASAAAGGDSGAGAGAGGAEGQVRASHLLVKHNGSRRPSSWKEERITRSISEAKSILSSYQSELVSSSSSSSPNHPDPNVFASLAQTNSDCSSHRNGGDLGFFGKGQMQRPFEEATYGLAVGEMSGIVETDSGVHLILRTA